MSRQHDAFLRVARAYETSTGGPIADKKERRRLYGLYKQATEGDNESDQPGFFNFEDQAKYKAWSRHRGMAREEAKRRFVKLAEELGYRDPGEVPVDWISGETWLREESWTNPDYQKRSPCITDPEVVEVEEAVRQVTPRVATSEKAPKPPKGSDDEHRRRLEEGPETISFHLYSPTWPVCCRRLMVLVGYRGVDEDVVHALAETRRIDDDGGGALDSLMGSGSREPEPYGQETLRQDLALYHCHDCGRLYLAGHDS